MMHSPFAQSMTNGETIMASADIEAPPDHIFRALVGKEVEQWWGSAHTDRVLDWSADLRVGGRWTVVVRTADGRDLPAGGEFLEIEAPRRIVQTRAYAWDHPTLGGRQTTVAWLLEPIAKGTRLTICHGGFAGLRAAATEHAEGWGRMLTSLQGYVEAGKLSAALSIGSVGSDLHAPSP